MGATTPFSSNRVRLYAETGVFIEAQSSRAVARRASTAFESSTTRGQVVRPRFERSAIFHKDGDMSTVLAKAIPDVNGFGRPSLMFQPSEPVFIFASEFP